MNMNMYDFINVKKKIIEMKRINLIENVIEFDNQSDHSKF
jgi:hypothetical protein